MRVTKRQLWSALSLLGDPAKAGVEEPKARKHTAREQPILNAVLAALRLHPKVAWCARMNSGAHKFSDGRFIRFGFPGCPDVLGQLKTGAFLAVEVKAETGRVTEDQASFIAKVKQFGGCAGVARSAEEAIAIVEGTA